VTLRDILEASAGVFGVGVDELLGLGRSVPLVHYRHAAWAATVELVSPAPSWVTIARFYGRRDDSTVRDGARRIRRTNPELVDAVVDAHRGRAPVAAVADQLAAELRRELAAIRADVDALAADLAELRGTTALRRVG
jgi:hypothetical protein